MSDQESKPVVLLIYANTGQPLAYLKEETDTIAGHLKASGLCDVETAPAATLTDVVTVLNAPALRDRIVIVHYAGHANGQGIQLGSEKGDAQDELAHMRGLAGVLKQQPHLRLLFINGCASREQVLELTQAGIPLVVATNRGIDDKVARDFADHFYRTLGQERSIADAFNVAAGTIQAGAGENTRGLYFGDFQESRSAKQSDLPWEIHGPDDDRRWTLVEPYYRGTGPRWDHTKYEFNQASPYLSLRYFAENDSNRFFGRDDLVEDLLVASETAPLLLVTGASGTGKSSVVRAGMIPAWRERHRDTRSPRVLVFTPEDAPFDQLSTSLAALGAFPAEKCRDFRQPSPTTLRDAFTTLGQGEPWLFFIDQFEQVFTRTKDEKKRGEFLDSITDLARTNEPNVCLVLAMRDDFFPQLRDYPKLFKITDKHFHRVAALDRKALEEVIQRPAAEHGVTFEPGLVDDIIDAIDGQPGALPLLQYTLNALWEQDDLSDRFLNKSTYSGLGGALGSLGRRFEELYNADDDEARKNEFRWMMLKLVTYDEGSAGTNVVSRLAPKSEFKGQQAEFLDQLITEEKLLVSSGTSTPSVQLGHERIIEAWPKYADWTRHHQEANSVRHQLSKAASDWETLKEYRSKAARALWQGSQLEKALELRKQGEFDKLGGLDPDDHRFLDASYRRSRRLVRSLQVALCLISLLAGSAGLASWSLYRAKADIQQKSTRLQEQRTELQEKTTKLQAQKTELQTKSNKLNRALQKADREAAIADIRRLTALASLKGRDWPQTSILIAVEAVQRNLDRQKTDPEFPLVAEAHQVLRDSLMIPPSQDATPGSPDLCYQEISPDGRWLVSVEVESSTARVWDANDFDDSATSPIAPASPDAGSGRPVGGAWSLQELGGAVPKQKACSCLENVSFVAFSPDSSWLATWSPGNSNPALWYLASQKPLDSPVTLESPRGRKDAHSVAFSDDGRWLIVKTRDGLGWPKDKTLYWLTSDEPSASLVRSFGSWEKLYMGPYGGWLVLSRDEIGTLVDLSQGTLGTEYGIGTIDEVEFSPDERVLVTGYRGKMTGVWSLKPGESPASTRLTGQESASGAFMFSRDGRWLFSRSRAGVFAWKCQDGEFTEPPLRLYEPGVGSPMAIGPNGRWLVTAGDNNTARIWDMQKEENARSHAILRWHQSPVTTVQVRDDHVITETFSPSPKTWADLLNSSDSPQRRLWLISESQSFVSPVVLHVRGQYETVLPSRRTRYVLAILPEGRSVRIIDLNKTNPFSSYVELEGNEIRPIGVRDGEYGGYGHPYPRTAKGIRVDRAIYLWDSQGDGDLKPTAIGEDDSFGGYLESGDYRCTISPDRCWVAYSLEKSGVRLVNLNKNYRAFVLPETEERRIWLRYFTPDGRYLITAAGPAFPGTHLLLWDLRRDDPSEDPTQLPTGFNSPYHMKVSPDGKWLVAKEGDQDLLRVWDLKLEDPASSRFDLPHQVGDDWHLTFSPDSTILASGINGVHLWDLSSGSPKKQHAFQASDLHCREFDTLRGARIDFSVDGRWLTTTPFGVIGGLSERGNTRVFDLWSRHPPQSVLDLDDARSFMGDGHTKYRFSEDSRWLASWIDGGDKGDKKEVNLWDLSASDFSQATFVLRGHTFQISDVAISPDSRWLITAGGTVRLWDLHAEDPSKSAATLRDASARSVLVSADSRWLLAQESTGTMRIWHLSIEELLERARSAAGRELTPKEREDLSL